MLPLEELPMRRQLEIERAQAMAYHEVMMSVMADAVGDPACVAAAIARGHERFELICAQRGWAYPPPPPLLPAAPCLFVSDL